MSPRSNGAEGSESSGLKNGIPPGGLQNGKLGHFH